LQQASNSVASRTPAIDLKLRLALRVAALAAICFIAVAAYALFDSDRVAKAKASRIAEIVARDLSLQQSHAKWLSVSINATPDLQSIAALMEPALHRLPRQCRRVSPGRLQRGARRRNGRARNLRLALPRHLSSW
jgi:hypothetical protein